MSQVTEILEHSNIYLYGMISYVNGNLMKHASTHKMVTYSAVRWNWWNETGILSSLLGNNSLDYVIHAGVNWNANYFISPYAVNQGPISLMTFRRFSTITEKLYCNNSITGHQGPASYQYRKSHCGDKTIVRSSYLHNGISYTGKTISLYWIRPQIMIHFCTYHDSAAVVSCAKFLLRSFC